MGGIYGDFLLAFPEQKKTVTVYSMTAKVNGGWAKVDGSEQTIKCIFQHSGGRKLKDSNGNKVEGSSIELWTTTAGLNGMYTTIEDTVYLLSGDNQWNNEGGYSKYSLEKVVGNNGTESTDTTWNSGSNNFG